MSSDLRARVANVIARVTASKAADEVLAEIQRDHVIVPREAVAAYLEMLGWRDVYHGDAGPFLDALYWAGMPMDGMSDQVQFWHPPALVKPKEQGS